MKSWIPEAFLKKSPNEAQPQTTPAATVSVPPPITGFGAAQQQPLRVVSGAPTVDPAQTQQVISMVTETVPAVKALLEEAEKIAATVPDLGTRLGIVMQLRSFTAAQAADAVAHLKRALADLEKKSNEEATAARRENVDAPTADIKAKEAEKTDLQRRIAQLDGEITELRERAAAAEGRIEGAHQAFTASVAQAGAWIDNLARLMTKSPT